MRSMVTRREFLGGATAAACATLLPQAASASNMSQLFSAARIGGADRGAAWNGAIESFALPARGHEPIRLNTNDIVIVGRRPGAYAAIADTRDVARPARILAPTKDCVFAGHAAVSPQGRTLVTSEFEIATTRAVIAVRDPATGAVRARWEAGGIEPHDLLFTTDSSRLVVAVGALVHDGGVRGPAYNEGGIDSAIVEMDAATGRVLGRHKLAREFASLSLRHMALAPDGKTIAFAMQDQDLSTPRPLVGILHDRDITLMPLPDDEPNLFRGYIGSVAIDASGSFVAATSPRGGALGLWSLADACYLGALKITDVCGLATDAAPGVFWATSGMGEVIRVRATNTGPIIDARWRAKAQFDNHLLRI
jgi:hypothetical protein